MVLESNDLLYATGCPARDQKAKKGKLVLIPVTDQTHGHGIHTWAVFWQQYLQELLEESK